VAAAYKLCARCGAEFQLWVARCTDCDESLDLAPTFALPPEASAPLPHARELTCVLTADAWGARELAEALAAAGVPCRIDSHPPDAPLECDSTQRRGACAPKLGVYVRAHEAAQARAIEAALLARRSPEVAELGPLAEPDANACPACAAPLDPAAPDCQACGLAFPPA